MLSKQIKNLTDRWLTRQKMSEVLNVDENVINQTLEEIGMKQEADDHEALIEKVSFAHNKGMNVQEISMSLAINPFQVKHIINNLPKKKEEVETIEKKKIQKLWTRWTDEEVATMKRLKKKGYSIPQIAAKMKKTERQVAGGWRRYVLHPDKNVPPVSSVSVKNDVKTISPKEKVVGYTVQMNTIPNISSFKKDIFKREELPTINEIPLFEQKEETRQEENSSPIVITIDRGNKLDIIEYLVKNNIKAHIEL